MVGTCRDENWVFVWTLAITGVWQEAQLFATRGKPITFFVKPIGSSCPCSHATPSDAKPPGPGSFSGNMRGSTKKIQYGIPASCSAPMEPYLKRISGVAVTQSGCGSSRKNLYQPMAPPTTARTTTSSKQLFHQDFFFGVSAIVPPSLTLGRANCPTKRF